MAAGPGSLPPVPMDVLFALAEVIRGLARCGRERDVVPLLREVRGCLGRAEAAAAFYTLLLRKVGTLGGTPPLKEAGPRDAYGRAMLLVGEDIAGALAGTRVPPDHRALVASLQLVQMALMHLGTPEAQDVALAAKDRALEQAKGWGLQLDRTALTTVGLIYLRPIPPHIDRALDVAEDMLEKDMPVPATFAARLSNIVRRFGTPEERRRTEHILGSPVVEPRTPPRPHGGTRSIHGDGAANTASTGAYPRDGGVISHGGGGHAGGHDDGGGGQRRGRGVRDVVAGVAPVPPAPPPPVPEDVTAEDVKAAAVGGRGFHALEALRALRKKAAAGSAPPAPFQTYAAVFQALGSNYRAKTRKEFMLAAAPGGSLRWLLRDMAVLGFHPDVQMLNNALAAFSCAAKTRQIRQGPVSAQRLLLAQAQDLLLELEQGWGGVHPPVAPDVISYNTLVKACCIVKDIERALETLEHMAQKGISPNTITYNTIIYALVDLGDLRAAEDALVHLTNQGLKPDTFTMDAFVRGHLATDDPGRAVSIVQHAFNQFGCTPSTRQFLRLVEKLLAKGDQHEARRAAVVARQMWPVASSSSPSPKRPWAEGQGQGEAEEEQGHGRKSKARPVPRRPQGLPQGKLEELFSGHGVTP